MHRWGAREFMYTDPAYEPQMPQVHHHQMAPQMPPQVHHHQMPPPPPIQRQVVYMPPPAYYWPPPQQVQQVQQVPPPPPPWEYRRESNSTNSNNSNNNGNAGRGLSSLSLDDASAGFSRLEGEVKRSLEESRRRGLSRDVYVKQRNWSGVTKPSGAWDVIQLRVADDDGAPQEYKKALLGEVLRIVDDVKSRLLSNLLPTHAAAAVGALDVLRHILRYYDAVVAGTSEQAEPRYEAEAAGDLKRLLAVTVSNASEIKHATKRAVREKKMTPESVQSLNEVMVALLEAYKACDGANPGGGAGLGLEANSARAHVNKLVADAALPLP